MTSTQRADSRRHRAEAVVHLVDELVELFAA